jgi:hypothetical protein
VPSEFAPWKIYFFAGSAVRVFAFAGAGGRAELAGLATF